MKFSFSDKVQNMRPSIIRELLKQMSNPELISFAGGNPDTFAFPTEEIRQISDSLLSENPSATLQYSITEGYPPLLEAGKKYLNSLFPIVKDTDTVIITSGSQQVMDFMAKLLCNEGDIIATENPAFLGALNSFRSHGAVLAGVEMEPDGVNLKALEQILSAEKKPRFFYTIPNFQNPTGVTTSLAKRKAIYQLCTQYGVPILEDNPYGELRIAGEALPPIKSFDTEGAVVYAASLSKIFAPGLRVAFCVGVPELLNKMVVAKQGNDVHTNLWAQRVCERFLTQYDMQAHLTRLQEIYSKKANHMMAELDRTMGGKVEYVRPEGGMFIWLTLPDGVDMQAYVKACLDEKVALVPGNAFFVDDQTPCNSVRVNFSTPSFEQITQGTQIMAQVLARMSG